MENNKEVLINNTSLKDLFIEYLILKKPVLEVILSTINKKKVTLSPKILNVFALFLYYNYINKDLSDEDKWNIVFNYDTKVKIMKQLDITDTHLNTYISILRSVKLLNGRQISLPFMFYPEPGFELTFKFQFTDEK